MTAWHVLVPDGETDVPTTIELSVDGSTRTADCRIVSHDVDEDWVVLAVEIWSGARVWKLRRRPAKQNRLQWTTHGFPTTHEHEGAALTGHVASDTTTRSSRRANGLIDNIQLYCEQAAASLPQSIPGFSGGPVIVEDRVIGVIREFRGSEGLATGGTIDATPIRVVLEGLAKLGEEFEDEPPTLEDVLEQLSGRTAGEDWRVGYECRKQVAELLVDSPLSEYAARHVFIALATVSMGLRDLEVGFFDRSLLADILEFVEFEDDVSRSAHPRLAKTHVPTPAGLLEIDPLYLAAIVRIASKIPLDPKIRFDRVGDRVRLSSTRPYSVDEIDSWWALYEQAAVLDRELGDCAWLLQHRGHQVLSCRSVHDIATPERFGTYVRTDGWESVDARLRISRVKDIVERLGGSQLYGDQPVIALRELIQNASDAVRARRVIERADPNWGDIDVRLRSEGEMHILEVEDSGKGMTRECLSRVLLDFGSSYWTSALAAREHPELQTEAFVATGKFGIGFFSVFMIASRVRITTLALGAAVTDTLVLEFRNGLQGHAVLRPAERAEQRRSAGTKVELWLLHDPQGAHGLLSTGVGGTLVAASVALEFMCAAIAPALDVNLYTEEPTRPRVLAVRANDWWELDALQLVMRLLPHDRALSMAVPAHRAAHLIDAIRPVTTDDGNRLGRLALSGRTGFDLCAGVVVVGGLRAAVLQHFIGIAIGDTNAVRRNRATPRGEAETYRRWAEEQAVLATSRASQWTAVSETMILDKLGVFCRTLPMYRREPGPQSYEDIVAWLCIRTSVRFIVSPFDDETLRWQLANASRLEDDVVLIMTASAVGTRLFPYWDDMSWWPWAPGYQGEASSWPYQAIVRACMEAWDCPREQLSAGSPFKTTQVVGVNASGPLVIPERYVFVVTRPASSIAGDEDCSAERS